MLSVIIPAFNEEKTLAQVLDRVLALPLKPQIIAVTKVDVPEARAGGTKLGKLLGRRKKPVKVLGEGSLSVALQVSAHRFSESAVEKITAAGGSVNQL